MTEILNILYFEQSSSLHWKQNLCPHSNAELWTVWLTLNLNFKFKFWVDSDISSISNICFYAGESYNEPNAGESIKDLDIKDATV